MSEMQFQKFKTTVLHIVAAVCLMVYMFSLFLLWLEIGLKMT